LGLPVSPSPSSSCIVENVVRASIFNLQWMNSASQPSTSTAASHSPQYKYNCNSKRRLDFLHSYDCVSGKFHRIVKSECSIYTPTLLHYYNQRQPIFLVTLYIGTYAYYCGWNGRIIDALTQMITDDHNLAQVSKVQLKDHLIFIHSKNKNKNNSM
jgi:hypothetical protein